MKKKIIYFLGTGFGSGYVPVAPGTAGSLVAALIFFILPLNNPEMAMLIISLFVAGVYLSGFIEKEHGKDPGLVVIDEFVGQWIALLFLPKTVTIFALGFFLFRVFDIWKPFPIDRLQKLKNGWGIMADDVLAGIYANFSIQLIIYTGML